MTKRRVILITLLLALAVAAFFVFYDDGGPKYKGKSLREWVEVNPSPWVFGGVRSATDISPYYEWRQAIQHYDTNAIPYLLEWVQIERPPLSYSIRAALGNAARKLGLAWPSNLKPFVLPEGAEHAFYYVGPHAENAIPELEKILHRQWKQPTYSAAIIRHRIVNALGGIGPKAFRALTNAFAQETSEVRKDILARMRNWGTNARVAVPWLLSQTMVADTNLAHQAWAALKGVDLDYVLLTLSNQITYSDPYVRQEGVQIAEFLDFGKRGDVLIPALRHLVATDPNTNICYHASNALYQIEHTLNPALPK